MKKALAEDMLVCLVDGAGGASSRGGEGVERAAGHEGAGSGRRELEGVDAETGQGEDFRV